MSRINSRSKGIRGERQAIDLLQPIVNEEFGKLNLEPPLLQRNTLQCDKGGVDIAGLEWLALEVKNCQTFDLKGWWAQTIKQKRPTQVPVLFYKKNNVPFRVMTLGGVGYGEVWKACVVDVKLEDFLEVFRRMVACRLQVNREGVKP